ncbi:uncharacterized protein EURHEDRAFT_510775 [Aspergillus ruber CBS 135680]|uniref:Mid2 domain-containing protein n=1 Tax=Aspergillus ruber (strain CBS 135680) TaxID=1388766 RepID=A0A017S058_ASPRC|nr:uncharacterized protein EURHEDRAFT_510775 [Aspergillus ruber CBS 135680]EYE90423.1 hypothetical protein EURHEDRAFT_510775 [Aspergillus ruber CBS 135680]
MLLQRSFLAIALACTAAAASERTCYYPNGHEASGNVPCTDSQYTSCCGENVICLSNGYCMDVESQPYTMSQSACTDSSWAADCPSQCAGSSDYPDTGCAIVLFYANSTQADYYCNAIVSDGTDAACSNGQTPFTIPDGKVVIGRALLSNSSTTSKVNATCVLPTTTVSPLSNNKRDVAIGAGVGVPLGVLLLTALAWALFERKRRYAMVNSAAAAGAVAVPSASYPVQMQQPVLEMDRWQIIRPREWRGCGRRNWMGLSMCSCRSWRDGRLVDRLFLGVSDLFVCALYP